MKIKVIGKAHMEGKSKRTGNEYNFNQVHYIGMARSVEGQAALTRLTKLEPELQQMVEEKKLPVNTAADISYLKPDEQKKLADSIAKEGGTVPSGTQAAALKKESMDGKLTEEKIEQTVAPHQAGGKSAAQNHTHRGGAAPLLPQ